MVFIKNHVRLAIQRKHIKDKAANQQSVFCILYATVLVKGLFGNWVRFDYRIALCNRSYDRLKTVKKTKVYFFKDQIRIKQQEIGFLTPLEIIAAFQHKKRRRKKKKKNDRCFTYLTSECIFPLYSI